VWGSLAIPLALGARERRFESCRPHEAKKGNEGMEEVTAVLSETMKVSITVRDRAYIDTIFSVANVDFKDSCFHVYTTSRVEYIFPVRNILKIEIERGR
jgi:hypothetical protein